LYRHTDVALLRAARHPVALTLPDWPDLTGDPQDNTETWCEWLRQIWQTEGVSEAVELASPVLAHCVGAVAAGKRPARRQVRRMVESVARYLLRATGRPTPFGLFAGVAAVGFAPALKVRWGERHRSVARASGWMNAFAHTGRALHDLAHEGTLTRGLRAVLAHHILFHWNRLGLPYSTQGILATTARDIFDEHATTKQPTKLHTVDPDSANATQAEVLRAQLVDQLRERQVIRTCRVEAAMRATPRHLFLPGTPVEAAYADQAVVTKRDPAGASLSSASQPAIVAMMLEQLDVQPGHRILEIGAGTGYNAALLACLAGPSGQVTTIDLDADVVAGAHNGLAAAGHTTVSVVCADGTLGDPAHAPYDRLIITAGALDLAPAWLEQLADHGRIVVPLRMRGLTRSIAFDREKGHLD
jgi:protein-L-isoaspartate(D-aspartate) O-methyltransferase